MSKIAFLIADMDCAEEVIILKRELGHLVDEGNLSFDVLRRKMTVVNLADEDLTEAIIDTVSRTGMKAIPWSESQSSDNSSLAFSLRTNSKAVFCAVSGLSIGLGFLHHWLIAGFQGAITSFGSSGQPLPFLSHTLYLAAIITGAWHVAPKAAFAAVRMRPDMNLLMLVAAGGAMLLGDWFEASMVCFLFSFALLLETWSAGRARKAIEALLDITPATARFICPSHGEIIEKPVEEISIGTTVVVRPGERVPLDGVLNTGTTTVNQAPITGESVPVEKAEGDEVFAGSINNEGAFEFQVTKESGDTTLARIVHMVEEAQSGRAPSERWVETFARYYTPAMMLLATGIAVFFPLIFDGQWEKWFYHALVILVIACPCALVISTPISIVAGLASAARAGILIKGGAYLEAPARLRGIALDKTGTLTRGEPAVQEVVPFNGHSHEELLSRAASLEANSEHPVAKAILARAEGDGVKFQPAENYLSVQGKGAEARLSGRLFWIGSHRMMHEKGNETAALHEKAKELEGSGLSVVAVGNEEHVCGLISVADSVRDQSADAVQALRNEGIRVIMLTGDHEITAGRVAAATGVDEFRGGLLPEDKVDFIRSFSKESGPVAMVGDGVNDAPAMAAADLGIAMGAAGSDVAIETADIALMADDLSKLGWLIDHSKRTLRIIKENVFLSLGIKVAVLGAALLGAATLWMAIAADMGATLLVIFNGLRLLRMRPDVEIDIRA